MPTDKKNDRQSIIERILRERLDQFEVPAEIRNNIRDEILAVLDMPEKNPFGACVMTPEASMAASEAKSKKTTQIGGPKPRII